MNDTDDAGGKATTGRINQLASGITMPVSGTSGELSGSVTRSAGTDVEVSTVRMWNSTLAAARGFASAPVFARYLEPLKVLAEIHGEVLILAPSAHVLRRVETDFIDKIRLIWRGYDGGKRRLVLREAGSIDPNVLALVNHDGASADTDAVPPSSAPGSRSDAPETGATAAGDAGHGAASRAASDTRAQAPGDGAPVQTLDRFAIGDSNKSAHAIALRLANGSRLPSPIVTLCGPAGVGKTHLLRGIEHARTQAGLGANVAFMSAQAFLSEYVDGVRARNTRSLEARLTTANLVLLDDLHWLAGRPGTQDQFFQLLRETVRLGNTVVMSTDRMPSELGALTPRLREELRGGLTIEVSLPDEAVRLSIARMKAEEAKADAPDFALDETALARIAGAPCSGRDIAGIVANLALRCGLMGETLTNGLIDEVMRRQMGERKEPSMAAIRAAVSHYTGVSKTEMDSARKQQSLVMARHKAMFLCKQMTAKSLPQIGRAFGGRDHATVLHAVRKMHKLVKDSPAIAAEIAALERMVRSGQHDAEKD